MPRVLNKHHYKGKELPENSVYVGRPSIWGNPFAIGKDGTREEVVAKYKERLFMHGNVLIPLAQRELKDKDLVCWCAPKPCHADILLEIANAKGK